MKTVQLDVDGTLLDTREFILAAFEHTARQHGFDLPGREVVTSQIGLPLEEIYARMTGQAVGPLIETHRSFQEENLHLAATFPGAVEALAALRDAGLALAAVTSRSRRTSLLTLELAGLLPFFGAVVSAEDCVTLKPDPAPLHMALNLLGRGVEGAAMVGDTPHDIEAGRALGLVTVGASYGFFGPAIADHAPDHLIGSIGALPGVVLAR
jgi:pyrophosphatase PpaX